MNGPFDNNRPSYFSCFPIHSYPRRFRTKKVDIYMIQRQKLLLCAELHPYNFYLCLYAGSYASPLSLTWILVSFGRTSTEEKVFRGKQREARNSTNFASSSICSRVLARRDEVKYNSLASQVTQSHQTLGTSIRARKVEMILIEEAVNETGHVELEHFMGFVLDNTRQGCVQKAF